MGSPRRRSARDFFRMGSVERSRGPAAMGIRSGSQTGRKRLGTCSHRLSWSCVMCGTGRCRDSPRWRAAVGSMGCAQRGETDLETDRSRARGRASSSTGVRALLRGHEVSTSSGCGNEFVSGRRTSRPEWHSGQRSSAIAHGTTTTVGQVAGIGAPSCSLHAASFVARPRLPRSP